MSPTAPELAAPNGAAQLPRTRRLMPSRLIGAALLLAIVVWWCWRALHDSAAYDTGLAYHAGDLAWLTGHPERSPAWDGTPLLAATMAIASRLLSLRAVADVIVVLSTVLWLALVVELLRRTRALLRPVYWWLLAVALVTFGPLMSTVWSKQFNALSLGLGVLGFEFIRRRKTGAGALAIGISVAFKPLLILLPFVLLARRETRRAGALAIAWIVGLSMASLALLAQRAHDLSRLNPLLAVTNFSDRSRVSFLTCVPWNYSPGATLCRLMGYWPASLDAAGGHKGLAGIFAHAAVQRIAAVVLVAVLGAWAISALRGRGARTWEVFAFTCPLSAMLSPLAWSHYQILLAPLFVLLWIRFLQNGAGPGSWLALVVAFGLASLAWAPYGSALGAVAGLFAAHRATEPILVDDFAQFAQYLLVLCGIWWYAMRTTGSRARATEAAVT
jgi:hypothetical protein